ncbi:type VI secretion system-associated FHA domain protein TagH [Massilia horti]|uniref:Type VI secretion system-associated FHA domain protein TagH n=1 Tax=Massilia horti TaxID=2562153 RepID=A0A4Y9T2Y9_9BURK|nr:type VI secretion system-associated FHA domain protein TagH [Massilia horti]TFW33897.1 type VI secretion system-associated FHA domain protein TagH [Massilia horti]
MPISVTVKDVETGAPAWQAVLPEPVATIGRNATCDLVLKDPEKHISRLHASIELRTGAHYLLVHSKINPVLVDGMLCQPGSVLALHDGSVVVMHPFELTMHAELAAALPAASDGAFAWLGERQPPALDADPFNLDVRASRAQPAAPQPDPFWRPAPPRSARLVDDIESSLALNASPNLDPLALLDKLEANGRPVPLDALLGDIGSGTRGPLVEFAGRKREREDIAFAPEHVHDVNLPFPPPACSPPAVAQSPANPAVPELDWLDELPPAAIGATPTAGEPCLPRAPTPESDSPALDAGAVEAFMRGLGCPAFEVPPGQEMEFFEKAGEIMQVAVQGLVTLLLSRGEIRGELRAEERTMVAASANNPLKFVDGGGEALRYLLDPSAAQPGAFLPPVKAIEEACGELVAHELGMLAGTRAAVIGAIRRFDPQEIEHSAAPGPRFLAWQRKARLWEAYVGHHAKVQADLADDLHRVFELDFLAAYREQVQRVTKN